MVRRQIRCRRRQRRADIRIAAVGRASERRRDRLAEQDLAEVVLQEERVGHSQVGEHADDVAVEEARAPARATPGTTGVAGSLRRR